MNYIAYGDGLLYLALETTTVRPLQSYGTGTNGF